MLAALNADFAFDEDEFLDPVTRDVIIDPIVASDGNTYDRCVGADWTVHEPGARDASQTRSRCTGTSRVVGRPHVQLLADRFCAQRGQHRHHALLTDTSLCPSALLHLLFAKIADYLRKQGVNANTVCRTDAHALAHIMLKGQGTGCNPDAGQFHVLMPGPSVSHRLTAYKLAVRGSNMPCAAGTLSLGPDNLHFRRRLRRAYPGTEEAMREQREACIEVRQCQCHVVA